MTFSEREGHKTPPSSAFEDIDPRLKNVIWTHIYKIVDGYISHGTTGYGDSTYRNRENAESLWTEFFNKSISDLPYAGDYKKRIEALFCDLKWFEVYDLVEWVVNRGDNYNRDKLSKEFNHVLEQYKSPYRVINGLIQPISDKNLVKKLADAEKEASSDIIRNHLIEAERLYSDRYCQNFSPSCLESIKAVEAYFHILFKNNDKLGDNIKKLKRNQKLNKHIVEILTKINAFRGDDAAHADKQDGYFVTKDDAILIHILCVGFIDYLKCLGNQKT